MLILTYIKHACIRTCTRGLLACINTPPAAPAPPPAAPISARKTRASFHRSRRECRAGERPYGTCRTPYYVRQYDRVSTPRPDALLRCSLHAILKTAARGMSVIKERLRNKGFAFLSAPSLAASARRWRRWDNRIIRPGCRANEEALRQALAKQRRG